MDLVQPAPQHIPYPDTSNLKNTKGTYHSRLKRLSPYKERCGHHVTFHGTVKIHGANIAAILNNNDQEPHIQSRNTIISYDKDDGYRSAAWFYDPRLKTESRLQKICDVVVQGLPRGTEWQQIMIAGEFAGKGINPKQTAISELDKFYVIFGIKIDGVWLDKKNWQGYRFPAAMRVFNIYEFKTYSVVIDFTAERTVGGGKKVAELALEVEKECPVALKLGGIKNGVGEGIVWTEERDSMGRPETQMKFKSKGPKFDMTLEAPKIDANGTDVRGEAEKFVDYAVTLSRFEQGIEYFRESAARSRPGGVPLPRALIFLDNKMINPLAEWIMKDVIKEELAEMTKRGLAKGIRKAAVQQIVTKRTREYFHFFAAEPRRY